MKEPQIVLRSEQKHAAENLASRKRPINRQTSEENFKNNIYMYFVGTPSPVQTGVEPADNSLRKMVKPVK